MARVHFRLETKLAPSAVLAVLTDFGPEVWPNIDVQRIQVHDQGPGRAGVTEGSSVAGVWEREKYTCGKGWKGRLIELALAAIGVGTLCSQMEQALARSAS